MHFISGRKFFAACQRSISILQCLSFSLLFFSCATTDQTLHSSASFRRVQCNLDAYRIENLCEDEKVYLDSAEKSYSDYRTLLDLNRENLRKVAKEKGDPDVAAALFYTRALKDPGTQELLQYLKRKEPSFKQKTPDFKNSGYTLVMVPGMFYRENPEVGADGRSIRKVAANIGLPSELLAVGSTSGVSENARTICNYLQSTNNRKIIIASTSKGGADFRTAIDQCGTKEYFQKVKGWCNIGGLLRGTYAVHSLDDDVWFKLKLHLYFLWNGYDWQGLMDLRSGKGSALDQPFKKPENLVMVNVIGTPLMRFVTPRAQSNYLYLCRYGPNDGYVLLADAITPGAYTYPVWRSDHYFSNSMPPERMESLISFIIEKAESRSPGMDTP